MILRLILSLVILSIFVAAPRAAHADEGTLQVTLYPTPLAEANGLADAYATALFDEGGGWTTITMKLPNGYKAPDKAVFEGWLIDTPEGQPLSHASNNDQQFGPSYANRSLSNMSNSIPYWLTLGALSPNADGTLSVAMKWPNYNLSPYTAIAVTIETDGNVKPWDPRPGSTILRGVISEGKKADEPDIDKLMG